MTINLDHVQVQGIHPDRVEKIIVEDFKIARKHIDQINKLKGKAAKMKKK